MQDTKDFGLDHERVALAIKDDAIGMRALYPQQTKGTDESVKNIRHFIGKCKIKALRTDNSRELGKAANDLGSLHETSTPHRPQSNTRIERDISTMLGGTRSALQQSGLPVRFWTYAAQHWCHSANTTLPYSSGKPLAELTSDTQTPWEQRRKEIWNGPSIPFGSLVHFLPPTSKRFKQGKFEPRAIHGLFFGRVFAARAQLQTRSFSSTCFRL